MTPWMSREELIEALHRVDLAAWSVCSMGMECMHERECAVHGCAIIRAAVEEIKKLAEENSALAGPLPKPPLTLEELREMDGVLVWVEFPKCPEASGWMIVDVNRNCVYNDLFGRLGFENCGKKWIAYRRKPERGV